MPQRDNIPNWFLWTWDHIPGIIMVILFVGAILVGAVIFVEHRLSDIEDRMNFAPPRSFAAPEVATLSAGGTTVDQLVDRHLVYVPVYSHIYYQGGSPYSLETTLSIRNVDAQRDIFLEAVDYYDTTGKLAKSHIDQLIKLKPLQTIEFLVESRDSSGGSGANFLIRWGATTDVDKPLIEAVMVGAAGTAAISFSRPGVEISLREE